MILFLEGKKMQLPLFKSKGGRPKKKNNKASSHSSRPVISSKTPLHITIKLTSFFHCLRNKKMVQAFKRAVLLARSNGLRIIHFSLQDNHAHLLIESESKELLSKGMQSFGITFSKNIQKVYTEETAIKAPRQVYEERYHCHILTTVRETKNALSYVLRNSYRHGKTPTLADVYSSILLIEGQSPWDKLFGDKPANWEYYFQNLLDLEDFRSRLKELLDEPSSWLLRFGWLEH